MCSPSPKAWLALLALAFAACGDRGGTAAARQEPPAPARALRVCSDPNNLPFSNRKGEGFENEIAELIARELGEGTRVEYTWWAQRRGFVRNTLNTGACDVIVGVPASYDLVLTTRPYYRSTYVFVSRRDRGLRVASFDDPALRRLRIGVPVLGDDGASSPPSHALASRDIVDNVFGYTVYGDYSRPDPPARLLDAVAAGEIDLAVAWGPLAGYYARRHPAVPLEIAPVAPQIDLPFLPFVFDISMGVRRKDKPLRDRLDAILERRQGEIDAILDRYGVPRIRMAGSAS
ncbi:MAG TPA: substrate-binding domain-containing protein [Thermoanaerobaculia bacterium]|jgi:mxaJ protein|nr:substrate-binding domain-containing protein [Thermoanaerobaculia bacterium]